MSEVDLSTDSSSEEGFEEHFLVVEKPMFGEYRCYLCLHRWSSVRGHENLGQECKVCSKSTSTYHLEALFCYCCHKCEIQWKYKRVETGLPCRRCKEAGRKTIVMPVDEEQAKIERIYWSKLPGKGRRNYLGGDGPHQDGYCEACALYGENICLFGGKVPLNTPNPHEIAQAINGTRVHLKMKENETIKGAETGVLPPIKI